MTRPGVAPISDEMLAKVCRDARAIRRFTGPAVHKRIPEHTDLSWCVGILAAVPFVVLLVMVLV